LLHVRQTTIATSDSFLSFEIINFIPQKCELHEISNKSYEIINWYSTKKKAYPIRILLFFT